MAVSFVLSVASCASVGSSSRVADTQAGLPEPTLTEVRPEAAEESASDDGRICRREIVTGTHRRVRVCTTREQREASRESARELLRDTVREPAFIGREE